MHTPSDLERFKAAIYGYYQNHARPFAWRATTDPYHIMVSEIMLQQTQTQRVVSKFEQFIVAFPDFATLTQAPLREVLQQWQGLGYNRRGMYLQKAAQQIMSEFNGVLPDDPAVLEKLHGIGPNTAGSIVAFAYNKPVVFIETNIRTVFLHHFFRDRADVHDRELLPLIAATVDHDNPRHWYYALMDYGVMLKKSVVNPSRRSRHHTKQSKFEGSERQIRGMIITALTQHASLTLAELQFHIERVHVEREPQRVKNNLIALCAEGMVKKAGRSFSIAN